MSWRVANKCAERKFYNPTRKHTNNGMLSPVDYETEQKKMNEAGV
jgi:putative transposase